MGEILTNRDMEQINKDRGKMKIVENTKEDSLMKQLLPLCMEDCELKDEEVEFPFSKEDDYPSLCALKHIDHFKNEDIQDEVTSAFSKYPRVTSDHLSEDELFEKLNSSELVVDKTVNFLIIKMVYLVMSSLKTF